MTLAVLIAATTVAGVLIVGGPGESRPPPPPPLRWSAGACVRESGSTVVLDVCAEAPGRVLAIAPTCPPGTDLRAALHPTGTACLAGLPPATRPGPVPPRRGDCVERPRRRTSLGEIVRVSCGSNRAWAKVTAFHTAGGGCPKGSDHVLRGGPTRICLTGR
ncbi:hypothetical protein [Acrocarpospora phusangensis]|uniref:hypothetical protein n=1 Tax=Acrocarpospora phusangensis TaxID=1070424 RepID=UPI0019522DAC|nr:hypothetical protein [Acrocarpospora phusangensis]